MPQLGLLSGKIVDKSKQTPLDKVDITIVGINKSTTSKPDGTYNIQAPSGKFKVIYSLPGFSNFEYQADFRLGVNLTFDVELTKLTNEVDSTGSRVIPSQPMAPSETAIIRRAVSLKPKLVKKEQLKLERELVKVVDIKRDVLKSELTNKSFSPRLINWVEPYDVRGFNKTLFYTEVNSGLKVEDRVFIINGNYDNDLLIKIDKYKKGRDGYKILEIDNCKVVLDIPYTGVLPYNDEELDQFINVYYVRDRNEFIQINRQITTRGGIYAKKFARNQNNIVFIGTDFNATSYGWADHTGISTPGFYVRNNSSSPSSWINISTEIDSGSYSISLSPSYSTNGKMKVMNGSFEWSGKKFQEGFVYSWEAGPTFSEWMVDVTYHRPILTKANFRDGNFNGKWTTGLFGRQNKQIIWDGDKSTWDSGTLLNTKWKQGSLNSKYTLAQSYFADFDENGIAFQKANNIDNNGRKFNFIIDSELEICKIFNGTIINTQIGTSSATYSTVENHLLSTESSFSVNVLRGYFESCYINNARLNTVEVSNSRSFNSKYLYSKLINSYFNESVIRESQYLSDNIIKILDYDEWSSAEYQPATGTTTKTYKFYVSRKSWERLKNKDSFYIKGLILNNNSKEVINFFDKKFKLTSHSQYSDEVLRSSVAKVRIQTIAFLSTPGDNEWKLSTVLGTGSYSTAIIEENEKKQYSIDIMIRISGLVGVYNFNRDTDVSSVSSPTMSQILGNIIDIRNAYIIDSDYNSGLVENVNWNSGNYINYNNDVDLTKSTSSGGTYDMYISSTSSRYLQVSTKYNLLYPEVDDTDFNVGNVVYLNSVLYKSENFITNLIIGSQGTNYETASYVSVASGTSSGSGLIIDIEGTGTVSNVIIKNSGIGYSNGDELIIQAGDFNSTVIVTGVSSSYTYLPTDYKIIDSDIESTYTILTLQEITKSPTSSVFNNLKMDGVFYTPDAQNRYGYLYKTKFNKSKIKSGIFRRGLFAGCLLENDDYDPTDKDYQNLPKIRNLVITDSIFSRNANILSKATYLYSHFVKGSDIWSNGIVQYSIWNGVTFSNGTIKQSRWVDGVFNSGLFYNSRSFDAYQTSLKIDYTKESLRSYWKDGNLNSFANRNDRWSWQNGTFNLDNKLKKSEFYKSDWENGQFLDGKFYSSKWYSGEAMGGIIGDLSLPTEDTLFYNGTVSFTTVENAYFYSSDTSLAKVTQNTIYWKDGIFNAGVFASNWQQSTASNTSIWENGNFNGGVFESMAKWKNGNFNGGKFISAYGWTLSNTITKDNYGWEDGSFNNGEFGNANLGTNSTWYFGQFNDGIFKGRVWNNGIFKSGEFQGSSTWSAIGEQSINAKEFVNSFRSNYYGLWRDGFFTEEKDKVIKDQKIWSTLDRENKTLIRKSSKPAKISNTVWLNGTFSHRSGEMNNNVWLNGTFENGKFLSSSFNPYVIRNSDNLNIWQLDDIPDLMTNGGFTNSLGGWIPGYGYDSGYATFSTTNDTAYYIGEFESPGLSLTCSTLNLLPGTYQLKFDLVTYSSPYNNMSIRISVGNEIQYSINNIDDLDLGTHTLEKRFPSGSFSIFADSDGQGGSLQIDNIELKYVNPSFNLTDDCIWKNGIFDNGEFHISKWENGSFIIGTGYGMIWKNGISNYMNAINIFWENGTWRNGNWYGSPIEFDGDVDNDFYKQLLFRGMNWSGTSSCHLWNVFENPGLSLNIRNIPTDPLIDDSIDPSLI